MNIPQDAPLVYISFSAEINQLTTEGLISAMANCANAKVKQVYLLLSTTGGNVINGFNLYSIMKGMPFELIIHNVGSVDSIGNVIFLAGNKRYASPISLFMFHGVAFPGQNESLGMKDLQEKLSSLSSDEKRISHVIAQHTKLTGTELDEFFRVGQTVDATYALEKQIIHEIKEVNLSPGSPVLSLVFQR